MEEMTLEPYQFKPESARLIEQPEGTYKVSFELATYHGQHCEYTVMGITPEHNREIEVNVIGDEEPPIDYHLAETPAFELGSADGVELVAFRDGKRKGSITVSHL